MKGELQALASSCERRLKSTTWVVGLERREFRHLMKSGLGN